MKKVLKITGKVLLGLLILIVLLLVIMTVYNQIMLRKNKGWYQCTFCSVSAFAVGL